MNNSQINLSWENIEQDIRLLANKIQVGQFDTIIAIAKGGIIPAYYLAKLLFIDKILTLNVSSYKDKEQGEIKIQGPIHSGCNPKWLIVDDLVDSGITMEVAKEYYPNIAVATLYTKENSPLPDFFVRGYKGWIVFPWEN